MKLRIPLPFWKRRRRYPIQRDDQGQTLRQLAFMMFDYGCTPVKVAQIHDIKLETVRRYHRAWRRLPKGLRMRYFMLKVARKYDPNLKHRIVLVVAVLNELTEEEASAYMETPWAWRTFLSGEWERKWTPPKNEPATPPGQLNQRKVVQWDHPGLEGPQVWEILSTFISPTHVRDAVRDQLRRVGKGQQP